MVSPLESHSTVDWTLITRYWCSALHCLACLKEASSGRLASSPECQTLHVTSKITVGIRHQSSSYRRPCTALFSTSSFNVGTTSLTDPTTTLRCQVINKGVFRNSAQLDTLRLTAAYESSFMKQLFSRDFLELIVSSLQSQSTQREIVFSSERHQEI